MKVVVVVRFISAASICVSNFGCVTWLLWDGPKCRLHLVKGWKSASYPLQACQVSQLGPVTWTLQPSP